MKTLSNYDKQAQDFLNKTGATITATFKKNGRHFDSDTDSRDIYSVTIQRGNRKFTFDFGQSIAKSQYLQDKDIQSRTYTLNGGCRTGNMKITNLSKWTVIPKGKIAFGAMCLLVKDGIMPTNYDILACLTTYDPNTFEDFCSEFGYDTDSKKAEKTYNAVVNEYKNVCALFTDEEIELLQEIQ